MSEQEESQVLASRRKLFFVIQKILFKSWGVLTAILVVEDSSANLTSNPFFTSVRKSCQVHVTVYNYLFPNKLVVLLEQAS